jgi:hypothetical protein
MVDNAGTNHIQTDVYQTPQQMLSGFDTGCMVAVLPKSASWLQRATESNGGDQV